MTQMTPDYVAEGTRPRHCMWATLYLEKDCCYASMKIDVFQRHRYGYYDGRTVEEGDSNIITADMMPWSEDTVFECLAVSLIPVEVPLVPMERLAMAGREHEREEELQRLVHSASLSLTVNYLEQDIGPLWAGAPEGHGVWHFNRIGRKVAAYGPVGLSVQFSQTMPAPLRREYALRAALTGYSFYATPV